MFRDIVVFLFGAVLIWYSLKGLYYIILAVWKEISPALFAIGRGIGFLLSIPLAPFVALWGVLFGFPETEEERKQREQYERETERQRQDNEKRRQDFEMIKEALSKPFEEDENPRK